MRAFTLETSGQRVRPNIGSNDSGVKRVRRAECRACTMNMHDVHCSLRLFDAPLFCQPTSECNVASNNLDFELIAL
jgi:hypothetical protein